MEFGLFAVAACGLLRSMWLRKGDTNDSVNRKMSKSISGSNLNYTILDKNSTERASLVKDRVAMTEMNSLGSHTMHQQLIIVMVGLPARGKSYITKMLSRYLNFIGFQTRVFNVGEIRRKQGKSGADSSFFNPSNSESKNLREQYADQCQTELYEWFFADKNNAVALFDATNTTIYRRDHILQRSREESRKQSANQPSGAREVFKVIFLESICDDPIILENNYRMKLDNEDYKGKNKDDALADFKRRVAQYEAVYEPVSDSEDNGDISYIKVKNVGQSVTVHNCSGYLPSHVALYLQNAHVNPRTIWLTRPSESEDVVDGILGDDRGKTTDAGRQYSIDLSHFIVGERDMMTSTYHHSRSSTHFETPSKPMRTAPTRILPHSSSMFALNDVDIEVTFNQAQQQQQLQEISEEEYKEKSNQQRLRIQKTSCDVSVLYGTQPSHLETASHLQFFFPCLSSSLLNELNSGDIAGMTPFQARAAYPSFYAELELYRLNVRYPGSGGESYADVIQRIRPIIVELERQRRSLVVIANLSVARCIYGYFAGIDKNKIPTLDIPLHTVIELRPGPYGSEVRVIPLHPFEEVTDMK